MAASETKAARAARRLLARCGGFSMLEVLISILITVVGLLGLAGLQAFTQRAEFESYQRAQALLMLNDLVDRINANRRSAGCFAFTTNTAAGAGGGTPYIGDNTQAGHLGMANCPSGFENSLTKAIVDAAVTDMDLRLRGSAETKGGNPVGAMIGARGCVSFDAATSIYTVVIAWQGLTDTFTPVKSCANGRYGAAETKRRAVWTTLRIANLSG